MWQCASRSGCLRNSLVHASEMLHDKKPTVGLLSRVYVQQHDLIKGKKKKKKIKYSIYQGFFVSFLLYLFY